MAETQTAEISVETWRFFNSMKNRPREPIGEVIDKFVSRLYRDPRHITTEMGHMQDAEIVEMVDKTMEWVRSAEQ